MVLEVSGAINPSLSDCAFTLCNVGGGPTQRGECLAMTGWGSSFTTLHGIIYHKESIIFVL
jgi:hypothetical protein